jgi:hypothetical protein
VGFGALRPSRAALPRRAFTDLAPALERCRIAFPRGPGRAIVSV